MSADRVDDLLEDGEELLWTAPRYRGLGSYLRRRWYLAVLVLIRLLIGLGKIALAHQRLLDQGLPADLRETLRETIRQAEIEVVLPLACCWFAFELVVILHIHYFVTDRRVGMTLLGGSSFWRHGHPPWDAKRGRRGWIFDWGKQPCQLVFFGYRYEDLTSMRLRFRIPHDQEEALTAALERDVAVEVQQKRGETGSPSSAQPSDPASDSDSEIKRVEHPDG